MNLALLGLDQECLQASYGAEAASNFPKILDLLQATDDGCSTICMKYSVAEALLEWQQIASEITQQYVFAENLPHLIEIITKCVTYEHDKSYTPAATDQILGYIHVGRKLAQLVENRMNCAGNEFPAGYVPTIVALLQEFHMKMVSWMCEDEADKDIQAEVHGIIPDRLDILTTVFHCIPVEGRLNFFEEHENIADALLKYTDSSRYPLAVTDVAIRYICLICKNSPSLLDIYGSRLIQIAGVSHPELKDLLNAHKSWLSSPAIISGHLPALLDHFGLASLSEALSHASQSFAQKLVGSVGELIARMQHATSAAELRIVINILLNISLVDPCAVAKFIKQTCESVGENLQLMLLLLRLLASASTGGIQETIEAVRQLALLTRFVSQITNPDEYQTIRQVQWGVLGALNVAKDHMPKADFLHLDTLNALKMISPSNPVAYANILKFNNGGRAQRGNLNSYLHMSKLVEDFGLDDSGIGYRKPRSNRFWNLDFFSSKSLKSVEPVIEAQDIVSASNIDESNETSEPQHALDSNDEAVDVVNPDEDNNAKAVLAEADSADQSLVEKNPATDCDAAIPTQESSEGTTRIMDTPVAALDDWRIVPTVDDSAEQIVGRNLFGNGDKDDNQASESQGRNAEETPAPEVEVKVRKQSVFGKLYNRFMRRNAIDKGKKSQRRNGVDSKFAIVKSPAAVKPEIEEQQPESNPVEIALNNDIGSADPAQSIPPSTGKLSMNSVVPVTTDF